MGELILLGQISITWCFLDFSVLCVRAKVSMVPRKSPGLVAFMGEKAEVLEVLAVEMSLCCTSPQGGTR